jgi:hypothetical protein
MRHVGARAIWLAAVLAASSALWGAEGGLRVLKAGPEGEVASLAEANEVRIVFSEPMVVLGRIPDPVAAPFFSIDPPVSGTFRWSGTDTLLFTPGKALPHATRFTVTVDARAAAVSGRALGAPVSFSFTTPTVRLRSVRWYRKDGTVTSPAVLVLAFNQPVKAGDVAGHLRLAFKPHPWEPPGLPPEARSWLDKEDPGALEDYSFKAAESALAARSNRPVSFGVAASWDEKRFPRKDEIVVLETASAPPPNAWMELQVLEGIPSPAGGETPGEVQRYTVELERAFFVEGLRCSVGCNPDRYNPLRFTTPLYLSDLKKGFTVRRATGPDTSEPLPRSEEAADDGSWDYPSGAWSLDQTDFPFGAAQTFVLKLDRTLKAADGQTLGYTWVGCLVHLHRTAFSSFESGFGVWEASGGPVVPFSARNLKWVDQWVSRLSLDDLMEAIRTLSVRPSVKDPDTGEVQDDWTWEPFRLPPPGEPVKRPLRWVSDRVQFYGLDLKTVLSPQGKGLVWAAVRNGEAIANAEPEPDGRPKATLLQVTDLGITVKDSPLNTLVWVTRLSDGTPVEGARVSVRLPNGSVFWTGTTDAEGLASAQDTPLRIPDEWWRFAYAVTAEKDGDAAYVCSDWNEGVEPWSFGANLDLFEAKPVLRGAVFPDRGVYKLGEEVHLKAILRSDTASGMKVPPEGQKAEIVLKDSRDGDVDKRTVTLNAWGAADWTVKIPEEAPLGTYSITSSVEGHHGATYGSFLVAAYRKPDFRVDASLGAPERVAGATLLGSLSGRYLFGAPMAGKPVAWVTSRRRLYEIPSAVAETFPEERWAFLEQHDGWGYRHREEEVLQRKEGVLDAEGLVRVEIPTRPEDGLPFTYTLEGRVTDVSRQSIAGRASLPVYPAPFLVGLRRPGYFVDAGKDLEAEVVAAGLDGLAVSGVKVRLSLVQVQWHSVRRAEGNGFYTWECERREVEKWTGEAETASDPAPVRIPVPEGGYFLLKGEAADGAGRRTASSVSFYALGAGYTAWERYDHNRIDLVPEKKVYRPGETARILVKSPWESAKALLTTEREGVKIRRLLDVTSTQQTVEVPIGEEHVPNLFVSVFLVKGRTEAFSTEDASDPGKPSFRMGMVELKVEDRSKRLGVTLSTDREEYRPAGKAKVSVTVSDPSGRPDSAEVTLWAVDYGVLSLTGYRTPDLLPDVWVEKALQVLTQDSRQRIVSRRVLTPKGADEGGGGGPDEGPGTLRKDFRVLAFYLGCLVTDAKGKVDAEVALPESLTTYRIMAVAQDKASRFGWAQREIRTSKPLLLLPAFPRFLALGDRASFGAVVHSRAKEAGTVRITAESLDPSRLRLTGPSQKEAAVSPGAPAEVRFDFEALGAGRARLRLTARMAGEEDAFEESLPVEVLVSPEIVAAYGQARPDASETLEIPSGVVPDFGGLDLELSSTAMVGLGEGARYLVDYPYGCAEQRASCALALVLASDLGDAFRLPGIEPGTLRSVSQRTLKDLEAYQCEDGGFVYWKGDSCLFTSPYLTSYVLHVCQTALRLGYTVKPEVLEKGYGYLERVLGLPRPENEGWWPAYTAWQAFAVKVLAEGGRNADSHLTRLYGYADRMPVFGLAYLADAMAASGRFASERASLLQRLDNAILPEGGTAHVEELSDPYLLWYWNSNIRSTAIVLSTFVGDASREALVPRLVRWLMKVRQKGRWGNTQENALAMEALVAYYRTYEKEVPDFTALVSLGEESLASRAFKGRSTEAWKTSLAMPRLLAKGPSGTRLPLTFRREGAGTLFYAARFKYATDALFQEGLDMGIRVTRTYEPFTEKGGAPPGRSFPAGSLVRVTLTLDLTKERRYAAVTDPLPAGFEPVESWFATTARDLARAQSPQGEEDAGYDWTAWWKRGGFDHVERHDDRVLLFATRLSEGRHVYSYICRATTPGVFRTAPARAEEMYEPEVFGRTATDVIEVTPGD